MKSSDKPLERKRKDKCFFCNKTKWYESREYEKFCPYCGKEFWNKPKDEIELHLLQKKWLEENNEKYFDQMIGKWWHLTEHLILSRLRNRKFLDYEKIEDLVQETMLTIIRRYKENPGFKIDHSFNAYTQQTVLNPLYNSGLQKIEKLEISFDAPVEGDDHGRTYIELLDETPGNNSISLYEEQESLREYIETVMDFLKKQIAMIINERSFESGIKVLIATKHFLNKKNLSFMNRWWNTEPMALKNNYELVNNNFKDALREFISTAEVDNSISTKKDFGISYEIELRNYLSEEERKQHIGNSVFLRMACEKEFNILYNLKKKEEKKLNGEEEHFIALRN